ncbi:MAG: cell division protein FtsB [Gammaproteobacteria bacterium]|uniref:Cell division protein FtsB n=1 Tax=Candidatus Thiopontia autotrophica TaxID=2841688 RepID=A0A8J6P910_9GAMM|nr:cell division protein FtsB [Candidatus Thiopontia autotrophica]MBL6968905.1 cell division protein FtsB [Gammaproteobacteria bacterium]
MRLLIIVLIFFLGSLQYKLWVSEKGIPRLWDMEQLIARQHEMNVRLEQCNQELRAEVVDLKTGREALEEHARSDLGMVKPGELFVSVVNSTEVSGHNISENDPCIQTSQ